MTVDVAVKGGATSMVKMTVDGLTFTKHTGIKVCLSERVSHLCDSIKSIIHLYGSILCSNRCILSSLWY